MKTNNNAEALATAKAAIEANATKDNNNVAVNTATNDSTPSPVKGKARKTSPLFDKKWSERVPEHVRNLVYIIRNNTEIRRYTAIGILNYLLQKGEIQGEKRYIDFLWNKFRVKVDGITREYLYTEPFFLNCLVAAFSSFSASAQKTINTFCKKEMSINFDKAVDSAEVNDIIASNEAHQEELVDAVEE